MIFVGYSDQHKAWKCFDPDTEKLVVSSSIQFDSENFIQQKQIESITEDKLNSELINSEVTQTTPENHPSVEIQNNPEEIQSNADMHKSTSDNTKDQEEISEETQITSDDTDDEEYATTIPSDEEDITILSNELENSVSSFLVFALNCENPTYKEAMVSPEREQWMTAVAKEFASLFNHKVLSLPCKLPAGFKALTTKMVLKLKEPEYHNSSRRMKARLCVRGFLQIFGQDYFFTFAPVATYNSLRLFLSLVVSLDFEIHTVDIITAFLHSPIKEEIYIEIPDGYPNGEELRQQGLVLRLLKCLYGLKQAPMESTTR